MDPSYRRFPMGCGSSNAVSSVVRPDGDDARDVSIGVASFEDIQAILGDVNSDVFIIDVRSPDEYKDGHIPTAINIPGDVLNNALTGDAEKFHEWYGLEVPDKDRNIVVSCLSGRRAQQAAETLKRLGYWNIRVYRGSWNEWSSKGGPVEK